MHPHTVLDVCYTRALILLLRRISRQQDWTSGPTWKRGRKGQRSKVNSIWGCRWRREKNEICRKTSDSSRRNSTVISWPSSSTTSSGNPRFHFRFPISLFF